jgi:uncharacterized protein (DUF1684 family)
VSDRHLTYVRDDVRGRITVTIIGPACLEDLTADIERQAADGTWRYALLYDERPVTAALSVEATRDLVALVAQLTHVHGERGRVAIVCRAVDQFGMARMYSMLAESRANLDSNVFYDLAAAEQWLDERRLHPG